MFDILTDDWFLKILHWWSSTAYLVWKGQIKLILWCLKQAAVTMQTDGCLFSPQEGSTESIYEPAYSQTLGEVLPKYQCSPVLLRRKLEWGGSDPSIFFVSLISLCFSQTLTWSAVDDACDGSFSNFWTHLNLKFRLVTLKDRMEAWESCNRGVDQACALLQFNSFRLTLACSKFLTCLW